jgi:predicted ATP-grasp superfamily ATP-dependent carboligase
LKQSFSVLIPDGESEFALFAAHCLAQHPNVQIFVLCEKAWSPIRFSRLCRTLTHKLSTLDDEAVLQLLADIVHKHRINVLLPTGIPGISFTIANRDALSEFVAVPPLPDRKSFEIANNKWLLSQFLEEHGLPGPKTILLTESILEKGLQQLEYPLLLKPISAWGGDGVDRFENSTSLRQHLESQDFEKLFGHFILQAFLPGRVVGFNVLSLQGNILATTMQQGIIPNTHKFAAAGAIEFIKDVRFFEASRQLFSALSWSGYTNVDTLCDLRDNKINILDVNPRFWGSLRGSLVAGVNFPYLACLVALQIAFPPPDYDLAHYYHAKTALRESLFRGRGKSSEHRIAFQETGLRFLLLDPLAETMRAFQQEILQP